MSVSPAELAKYVYRDAKWLKIIGILIFVCMIAIIVIPILSEIRGSGLVAALKSVDWKLPAILGTLSVVIYWTGIARENRAHALQLGPDEFPATSAPGPGFFGMPVQIQLVAMVGTATVATAILLLFFAPQTLERFPYLMPVVIGVIAFPSLLFTIIYMSKIADSMGFGSARHAFGLPPGTMRGVLAIGFMIMVLIFGAFTISVVSGGTGTLQTKQLTVPAETNAVEYWNDVGDSNPGFFLKSVNPGEDGTGGNITIEKPGADGSVVQIAQQVLTMLATALTAIVGFYFGSRTANEPDMTKFVDKARKDWRALEKIAKEAEVLTEDFNSAKNDDSLTALASKFDDSQNRNLGKWLAALQNALKEVAGIKALTDIDDPADIVKQLNQARSELKTANDAWNLISKLISDPSDQIALAQLADLPE